MDPRNNGNGTEPDTGLERDLQSIRNMLADSSPGEPPELIDLAVLNAAKRELSGTKRHPLRWIGAFATASVVVLTVTIVVQQEKTPAPGNAVRPDGAPLELRKEADAEKKIQSSAAAVTGAREAAAKEDNILGGEPDARRKTESSTSLFNEPQSPPPPAPEPTRQQSLDDLRSNSLKDADSSEDQPASSPPIEESVQAVEEQESLAGQSRRDANERFREEGQSETAGQEGPLADGTEQESDESATRVQEPRQWIEKMLTLKRERKLQQLDRELEAFRTAYPDYPLPPELSD